MVRNLALRAACTALVLAGCGSGDVAEAPADSAGVLAEVFHHADLTLFPDDPTPAHVAFAERVQELGIEFDTLTAVHPAPGPESDDDVLIALQ